MATTLQLRRYTTAELSSITGANGEVLVDTTKKTITVQDGSTAGGTPLATETFVTSAITGYGASVSAALVNYTTNANLTSTLTNYPTNANLTSTVNTAITNLVGGAPAVLDTLGEIATALNNNSSLAVTLTSSIALKANSSELSMLAWTSMVSKLQSSGYTVLLSSNGALVPSTSNMDLGTSSSPFRSLYITNNTFYFGNSAVSIDSSNTFTIATGSSTSTLVNTVALNTATSAVQSNITVLLYNEVSSITSSVSYQINDVSSNLTTYVNQVSSNLVVYVDASLSSALTSTLTSYTTNANLTSTLTGYATSSNLSSLSSNVWRAATTSTLGLVKADGTSITISNGIISSAGAGSSGTVLLSNGAVLKDNAGDSIALGDTAGNFNQGSQSVAIGLNAATTSQGNYAVAIGSSAATDSQQVAAVALGYAAGYSNQGTNGIAIGNGAGYDTQGANGISIGVEAGKTTQGTDAIAIGREAANKPQGNYAIALGYRAAYNNQSANSIVINATGAILNSPATSSFTVKPIRSNTSNIVLYYNTSSSEITYGTAAVYGPAFRAYPTSAQTITSGSLQKCNFGTESFDTNNNFASSRFTPTVEGYYQFNAVVRLDGATGTGECMIVLYKNGAEYARGWNSQGTQFAANFWSMSVSDIAYANGSTDYFEIYVQQGSGVSLTTTPYSNISFFSGCMIRGA